MATTLVLTAELSDLQPASGMYYRLKLQTAPGERSDNASLVRAVTNTVAGPTDGIPITLNAGDAGPIAWISDPLAAGAISATPWTLHLWASESDAAANVALRAQLFAFTNQIAGSPLLDSNHGTELGTAAQDQAVTSGNATATTINDHDRLVLSVMLADAGTMAAGYTATVSFNGQYPRAEGDAWISSDADTLALAATIRADDILDVRQLLKDISSRTTLVSDEDIKQGINSAVQTYSRDRPRLVAEAYSPDGASYDFPMPRLWIHGFSVIREIEYPSPQQFRIVLLTKEWEIIEDMLGTQPRRYFRLNWTTPTNGSGNLIVRYTTKHVRNTDYSTVPSTDMPAVIWLSAAYTADIVAARVAALAQQVQAVPGSVIGGGEQQWKDVAATFRTRYQSYIGQLKGETTAAYAVGDYDAMGSLRQDRIFHGRRIR